MLPCSYPGTRCGQCRQGHSNVRFSSNRYSERRFPYPAGSERIARSARKGFRSSKGAEDFAGQRIRAMERSIAVNPVDEFRRIHLLTNEVGGDEREAFAFINRNGRTIDAGAEA